MDVKTAVGLAITQMGFRPFIFDGFHNFLPFAFSCLVNTYFSLNTYVITCIFLSAEAVESLPAENDTTVMISYPLAVHGKMD